MPNSIHIGFYRNVAVLVAELVEAESVPLLPACRYKPDGMDKRTAWERTWRLQRIEDDIDALFDAKRLAEIEGDDLPLACNNEIAGIAARLKEIHLRNTGLETSETQEWLDNQVRSAWSFVRSDGNEGRGLDSDRIKRHLTTLANAAKERLVGDIAVPPKYATKDFQSTVFWRLRGKLDVPKERWVSFPHCSGEDPSLLIAWAGYDHLQQAKSIAAQYMDVKEKTGGSGDPRLKVLLACLIELLPWLKQWHNDLDPEFNESMGDFYEAFIAEEARQMGKSVDDARHWRPPQPKRGK